MGETEPGDYFTEKSEIHDCAVCGTEHEHTIYVYRFDMDSRESETEETIGPVTLEIDQYYNWYASVDDGFEETSHYWDRESNEVVIEVVEQS